MKNTIHFFLVFLMACVPVIAKAQTQEAHVHGLATLTLALEGDLLEIQFESPAADIVGFEHKAHSPEEKQSVKTAETILKSPKRLFSLKMADCTVANTTIDVSGIKDDGHDHHHSGGHDNHGHSEVKANYRFNCKDAENLSSMSITIFDQFPRIEKINVMWVTETQQGAELLTPGKNTVSLR